MCARWRLPLPSAGGAFDAGRKEGEGGGNAAVEAAVEAILCAGNLEACPKNSRITLVLALQQRESYIS
jgi:hypothetical protein